MIGCSDSSHAHQPTNQPTWLPLPRIDLRYSRGSSEIQPEKNELFSSSCWGAVVEDKRGTGKKKWRQN